jgi:guanylate kinase
MPGVILYGPPAAGKDTVTRQLLTLSSEYVLFRRLKVGSGRTSGYRMVSARQAETLRAADEILYENRRYESSYLIDRTALAEDLKIAVPIIHLGQVAGIEAVRGAFTNHGWLVVELWCRRDIAADRIRERGTGDFAARLDAWDSTERVVADLSIDTGKVCASEAARQVHAALTPLTSVD